MFFCQTTRESECDKSISLPQEASNWQMQTVHRNKRVWVQEESSTRTWLTRWLVTANRHVSMERLWRKAKMFFCQTTRESECDKSISLPQEASNWQMQTVHRNKRVWVQEESSTRTWLTRWLVTANRHVSMERLWRKAKMFFCQTTRESECDKSISLPQEASNWQMQTVHRNKRVWVQEESSTRTWLTRWQFNCFDVLRLRLCTLKTKGWDKLGVFHVFGMISNV